jgi:two-component system chemotaxis response regulator CheB
VKALPTLTDKKEITGVVCPECPGVLAVSRKGEHVTFRCRIGHVFSLRDLIVAKEDRLEAALWASVECLEELAALFRDLAPESVSTSVEPPAFLKRADMAMAHADAIRRIIDWDEAILLRLPDLGDSS